MAVIKEDKKGYIDIYHGKARAEGSDKAPHFEGRIKLLDGSIMRFKAWSELKEGITNNEVFSGYVYEVVKAD